MHTTVRGLLFGPSANFLLPEELLIWNAFYALEPFGDSVRYAAEIEAGIKGFRQPILPSECKLNVPLEDVNLEDENKKVASAMTEYVRGLLAASGQDLDQLIKEANDRKQIIST